MLKEFRVENNSGIADEIKINFEKGNYDYRNFFIKEDIVNPAVLYGRNSSGKTSILKSFLNLITIFTEDLSTNKFFGINNIYYDKKETKFFLILELNNKKYKYEIEVIYNEIINERLSINNKSYKREDYKEKLNGNNESFVRYVGREEIDKDITILYKYLKEIVFISTNNGVSNLKKNLNELIIDNQEKYEEFVELFKELPNLSFEYKELTTGKKTLMAYQKDDKKKRNLIYEYMISSGTRDFYEMLAILNTIPSGSLLVIDEVEKTFHSSLLVEFLKIINERFNIQIICSTHDTSLMKNLRPDQIYLVKNKNNNPYVERLSDKYGSIREIHNIEKLYFGGKFE